MSWLLIQLVVQIFILYIIFLVSKFTINNYTSLTERDEIRATASSRYRIYFKTFLYTTGGCIFLSLLFLGSDGSSCVSGDMFGCDEYSYDDEYIPATFTDAIRHFVNIYYKILPITMTGVYVGIWYEYKSYDGPENDKFKKFLHTIRNKIVD